MPFCSYKTVFRPCPKLFKNVMTEAGNCFTFNGYRVYRKQDGIPFNDTKQWSLDTGYRIGSENSKIPRPGSRTGLYVNLQVKKDLNDGLCKGPIQGFKVYVHLPNESPQTTKHYHLVPYRQFVQFFVDPKVITAAPEIRDFSVSKRQCFFENERYLRFFKFYTQNNCEAECLANLTLSQCNCLRFHIPSKSPRRL
jgi:acid-sensing ion channel, other